MLIAVIKKKSDFASAQGLAEAFELRADCLGSFEACKELMRERSLPIMITVRRKEEGGLFAGSEEERKELIEKLFALKPEFFDLESTTDKDFIRRVHVMYPMVKIICSHHNFTLKEHDLSSILTSMLSPVFSGYKIAVAVESTLQALQMLEFVNKQRKVGVEISGIALGERGMVSRILGPIYGNAFTYASVDEKDSLPGQLTLKQLEEIYHFSQLDPMTKVYNLIGNPVERSVSHYAHNRVFRDLAINAVYVKMVIDPKELDDFFSFCKKMRFAGLSITMPLKEVSLAFLDKEAEDLKEIRAVNTVAFLEEKAEGCNTDGEGAIEAVEERISLKGKKIVLVGAGGAAKAIAYAAVKRGAVLVVLNRTLERAIDLAKSYKASYGTLQDMEKQFSEGYDVLINCTPEGLPIDPKYILPHAIFMDVKTLPSKSPLLHLAKEKGASVIFGYEMFINQGVLQQDFWFQGKIIKSEVKKLLTDEVKRRISY